MIHDTTKRALARVICQALAEDRYEDVVASAIEKYFEGKVFMLWDIDDVATSAEEMDLQLSEDEMHEVIQRLHRKQDASIGISWNTLEYHIRDIMDEYDNTPCTLDVDTIQEIGERVRADLVEEEAYQILENISVHAEGPVNNGMVRRAIVKWLRDQRNGL